MSNVLSMSLAIFVFQSELRLQWMRSCLSSTLKWIRVIMVVGCFQQAHFYVLVNSKTLHHCVSARSNSRCYRPFKINSSFT